MKHSEINIQYFYIKKQITIISLELQITLKTGISFII